MENRWETRGESGPRYVRSELHTQPAQELGGGLCSGTVWGPGLHGSGMSSHDPVGYMQGCQLSIQGRVPQVVKSLSRWQTLREIWTLLPGTHPLERVPQPVGAHLAGESSSRRMFSSCVSTCQGFCFRKPWRERLFKCFSWFSAQPACLWSFTRRAPKVIPVKPELATPGLAATGALSGQGQLLSSPCAGKWDLRGGSLSGREHVGGHVVTCGPDMVTPEDGLAVGKQDPWGALLCASMDRWLSDGWTSASLLEVCAESGGLVCGGGLSVGLRSTIGSWLVPWDFLPGALRLSAWLAGTV